MYVNIKHFKKQHSGRYSTNKQCLTYRCSNDTGHEGASEELDRAANNVKDQVEVQQPSVTS